MNTSNTNIHDLPERYRKMEDVNEIIETFRLIIQGNSAVNFPLEEEAMEDSKVDMSLGFITTWILWFSLSPIEGRRQVDDAIDSLISTLQKVKTNLPTEDEQVKKEILHLLKRQLIGPNNPLY